MTTPDRPALAEFVVTVTLARGRDENRETRTFALVIPGVDEESARRGAVDIGLGVNTASGYQWKLADDRIEDFVTVRRVQPA